MNLLISNDDGFFSAGIRALAQELMPYHNVTVVAPESQRSGTGHGVTFMQPVRARELTIPELPGVPAFAIDGTPADCVRIGCTSLGLDVDIVISGINHGANLGSDVLYSGTVGAAMEGALLGKPAIAVSVYNHHAVDFSAAAKAALWAVGYIAANPLPRGMVLNINAPELPPSQIKGARLAGLCLQTYEGMHAEYKDPYNMRYFWMPMECKTTSFTVGEDFDERWVREGYITITPLHYDLTARSYMNAMDVSSFNITGFGPNK